MSQLASKSQTQDIPKSSITLSTVKDSIETKGILTFTLENTNVSVANALRRTLLSDIDIAVFDTSLKNKKIKIHKNTTRFNNEILKQRLDCIPIHIKDLDSIDDLQIEINETNDSDSLAYVTTKDFKIKNLSTDTYLDESAVRQIFPPDPLTKGYVLFSRLRPKITQNIPGQELHIECGLTVSNASINGAHNVVSTCAYGNTPDRVEQNNQWGQIESELEEKKYNANDIELFKKNWYLLKGKRFYKENSFDFKVESIGIYTNMELIRLACDVIIKKLTKIYEECQNEKLETEKEKTSMANSLDVVLKNEDYTIGKLIEFILHEEYYKKNVLNYVGFIKMHPHDTDSIIRLAFVNTQDFNETNVRSIISFACQSGINIFTNLKEDFN